MLRRALAAAVMFLLLVNVASADVVINGTTQDYNNNDHYKTNLKYLLVNPDKQGDPAFVNDNIPVIKATLEDPTRREIFDRMSGQVAVFNFAALVDAVKHWNLRLKTIANMELMRTGAWDYGYYDLKKAPTVGSNKWRLGSPTPFFFRVNAGQTSFAAITDLAATKTRGECAGALTACILKAAADVHGQVSFDTLHPAGSLELGWRPSINKHFVAVAAGDIANEAKHIPGDYVYMKNKDDYGARLAKLKKKGYWTGENCIYMGQGKYSGLGLNNLTPAQLRQKLADGYKGDTGVAVPLPLTDSIRWTTRRTLKVQ
jgi:hypothetical protein